MSLHRARDAATAQPRGELFGAILSALFALLQAKPVVSLGATTLLQLPGSSDGALQAMGTLVRSVPCYELRLGADPLDAPSVVADLLGR